MATSSKESRRRKILERGSDRLASITGQLENLPPPPPPHSENQIDTNPTPPSTAPLARDPPPDSPSQIAGTLFLSPLRFQFFIFQQTKSVKTWQQAAKKVGAGKSRKRIRSLGFYYGSTRKPPSSPPPHSENQIDTNPPPPSTAPSRDPPPDSQVKSPLFGFLKALNLLASLSPEVHDEASSSDANQTQPSAYNGIGEGSTGRGRLSCSGTFGVSSSRKQILREHYQLQALYFVLLTNVTLVMGRLLFVDRVSSLKVIAEENKHSSADDNNWAGQLSKMLEVGLVAKKAIDALFMDCSVYLIIIICGVSFI
ncbi:hypothetical protein F3Y22_tig00109987pilonHSYRG00157 [Hibiscus syriacus]|uniref:Uncharacterized protein n=1 Tax=Hibiscus syriacus TaxID=106335 RepID=A0A6A3BQN3_HIBSY|nr:hypothetical protein F3Y22_tig00109987pilonHSYRG00157 [Hibiscus syriacus]